MGRFLVTDSMVVRLLRFSLSFFLVPILEHCIFLEMYSFHVKLHNFFFPQSPLLGFLQLNVTSHDKVGGLSQTQIESLTAGKPEDQNGSHWATNDVSAGRAPSRSSGKTPSQPRVATCILWLLATSPIFKEHRGGSAWAASLPAVQSPLTRMLLIPVQAHPIIRETPSISRSSIPSPRSLCHVR